jgi:hypothetical protein
MPPRSSPELTAHSFAAAFKAQCLALAGRQAWGRLGAAAGVNVSTAR